MFKKLDQRARKLIVVGINVLFFFFFLFWVFGIHKNDSTVISMHNSLLPWVFLMIAFQMLGFFLLKVSFYDFALWFLILSYPFMFGLLFKDAFNLSSTLLWNPIIYFSIDELFSSYVFVILSLESFFISYIWSYRRKDAVVKGNFTFVETSTDMYVTGVVLLIIGSIGKIINDSQIILLTQKANSYSAYSNAVSSGIWDDIAYLFLPGIFFLFYSGKLNNRKKKFLFYTSLVYFVTVMMLTGSRKVQIFSILALVLGYSCSLDRKKLSVLKKIAIGFFSLLLVNIIIIIREYRFDLVTIIPVFVERVKSFSLLGDLSGEVFTETGVTILSVASIIKVVPTFLPFQYGMTYLRTLPSFLPIGWIVGEFFDKASSTYVINVYNNLPVGSSFIGDLYWNFGYVGGIFISCVCGMLLYKIMIKKRWRNARFQYAIYFSIFSQVIVLVRAEIFDVYRPIITTLAFVFVINQILRKSGE